LRADEKRVREVTELGLAYNLLTAYTSFVAIDTEVRNNGKATTVKQPLPLPQGVSDYAVGGNMAKSYASPMAAVSESSRSYDQSVLSRGAKVEKDKETATKWTMKALTVSEGLSKQEITRIVRRHLSEIEGCVPGTNLRGVLELRLTLNPDGTVKAVEVISPTIREVAIKKCLTEGVIKWQFPVTPQGRETRVTVRIDMI
jgi:Ca-activated chloride channel family protein